MIRFDVFLLSCLLFVLGVFAGIVFEKALGWAFFLFLFSALFCLAILFRAVRIMLLSIPLLFFSLGYWRIGRAQKLARPGELTAFYGKRVKTEGWVCEDPVEEEFSQKAVICAFYPRSRILAEVELDALRYGQKVQLEGTLKEPTSSSDFDYRSYLARRGIYFLTDYPEITVLGQKKSWKAVPVYLKNKLERSLEKICSGPQAGVFQALIFGNEEDIPSEWEEMFNRAGVRHIVAVSGTNITILSGVVVNFFLFLGLWRKQAFWVTLGLLFIYIIMIGAPACAVRAGIMAGLLLLATYFGRIAEPERLALFTLAFMLFFSPLAVFDLGFQLSFLAFLGLIYLSPFFSRFLKKIPSFFALRESVVSTFSAQVFVLPLLLSSFGRVSLVAPLANMLILPFIPFLTIAGFLCSVFGLVSTPLGIVLSLVPQFILGLLVSIIRFLSYLPWAEVYFSIPSWTPLLFYLLLALFVFRDKRRNAYVF